MSKPSHYHAVVIGGGIAGLSIAWYLQRQAAEQGFPLRCAVVEQSSRWGGKIQTERFETDHGKAVLVESGPDGFITRKPWAAELARELGLESRMLPVNDLPQRIYVLRGRRLVPLPEGLRLLVPTNIPAFLRSPLFSPYGKLRVLAEAFTPARKDDQDESLAEFIIRRFGKEALDVLAEPLLAGVYNADARQQSILATFPNFRDLEKQYGSLIRGMRQIQNQPSRVKEEPALVSFHGGMQELIDGLVNQLDADLLLNTPVERVGADNRIVLADGSVLQADTLVAAVPAHTASRLLQSAAPEAAEELAAIRYEGVGSIYLAYYHRDVPHPMDAYGVVIPGNAGHHIDGITFMSAKWPGRAPDSLALLRVFFGGPHTRSMLEQPDDQVRQAVQHALQDILGIDAAPLFHIVRRWPDDAYPQYDVNHRDRVERIERALPLQIRVVGSPYHGVGLPDCVHHAQQTAAAIAAQIRRSHDAVTGPAEPGPL